MFVLQITASCTLQQSKHYRLWCKTGRSLWCPTLCFDVAFPIKCFLYVCVVPLLSFPLSGAVCSILVVCWRFVMLCHWSNWSVFACWLFFSHCFFLFVCSLFLFLLLSDCEFTSFLCNLLFKAVYLFAEDSLCAVCPLLIVASLVVSMSIWLVAEMVCFVIDASLLYTHTRPENFPIQEVRALQLHIGRLVGHLSLFCYRLHFFPLFGSATFLPLGHTQANSWLQMWFTKQFPSHQGPLYHCQMFK